MLSRFFMIALLGLLALPLAGFGQEEPRYLRDRGTGIPTSMFATFVHKGEFLVYPFWEYYYNPDEEYKPAELGHFGGQDYRSEFRASESLIFASYGFTDRLALEIEAAAVMGELNKAPNDISTMPSELEESGVGDVQTQIDYYWRPETARGLGAFSYLETVYPFSKNRPLTGTGDYEFKLGQGIIRGFSWGTMIARVNVEYLMSESTAQVGTFALEYMRRLNPHWRGYLGVEGVQDEVEFITEAQYHVVKDRLFLKFNNSFGLTSKAPDWAPEYGVLIAF